MVTPSAGVHVTLPDYYSPENLGMIVPKTKDGRVVFMLPWKEATIAGTTGKKPLSCSGQMSCRTEGFLSDLQVLVPIENPFSSQVHQIKVGDPLLLTYR